MRSLRESMASTLSTPLAALSSATSRITQGGISNSNELQQLECCIKFLDGTHHVFMVEKTTTGAELRKNVLEFSGIGNASKKYFALQLSSEDSDTSYVKWLDDDKLVAKQVKRNKRRRPRRFRRRFEVTTQAPKSDEQNITENNQPHSSLLNGECSKSALHTFQFGVRFYPEDPTQVHDEYARYLVFLQLRQDLAVGRLRVPIPIAALLCSFILQAELGDYDADEHNINNNTNNSVASKFYDAGQCELLPSRMFENSSSSYADFISKVRELHKTHASQTPADAELCFLQVARKLTFYGLFAVRARDTSKLVNPDVIIGVSHAGVLVFRAALRTDLVDRVAEPIISIDWTQIVKISFKRKQFVIEVQNQSAVVQPQIDVSNGAAEEDAQHKSNRQHHQFELSQTADLISSKSSGHRHLHAHTNEAGSRHRRRQHRDEAGSVELGAAAVQCRGHHRRGHQQLDSGLHSTSTVSSSGCSTAARGGSSNNSRGESYDQHSSRSSSVYSANRESDGGGTAAGCFGVNMVSMAKLRGAITKHSIMQNNNSRPQTRRSITDSGDSGGSEIPRMNDASSAMEAVRNDEATELGNSSLQIPPTTTYAYILESSQACKALWKQCIEKHTFYRLETPERDDCENITTSNCDRHNIHSTQQLSAAGNTPRMLLQNLKSLGSRLRQSGGSGRFQQHRYYHHDTTSSSLRMKDLNDGEVSSSSHTSFRRHFNVDDSSNTNKIRFIRSSGFKSRLATAGAQLPSSSSTSSATTPTANKHILLNNEPSSVDHHHCRTRSGDADMTLVFTQNDNDLDKNLSGDDNLTPMASGPTAVLTKQTFSKKTASDQQQNQLSGRQAIIISSPALSKFNALTNFCRRTVNFIASSSSSQTLSAYAADSSAQVLTGEASSVDATSERQQQADSVSARLQRHAWTLRSSHDVASSPEAIDHSISSCSPVMLNNQLSRKKSAGLPTAIGGTTAPPPNNRQASSASLPVAAVSVSADLQLYQLNRRESPLLSGGAGTSRIAPKNTNIVWAQQRKAQQQAVATAALLLRQQQEPQPPGVVTQIGNAGLQQNYHSRQVSPEKSRRPSNALNVSVTEKSSPVEITSAVFIGGNTISPLSVARRNAAATSSPVATAKSIASIATPPVARTFMPPQSSSSSSGVWQLNDMSPSKNRQRDTDVHQQRVPLQQQSVVRSRSMNNYNVDSTTRLSVDDVSVSSSRTMLTTSVDIADHTDNSCSVSPSSATVAAGVVNGGNGGCKMLLKERRGMSVRKNRLPPLRLANTSVSDAFRVIAADQQLNSLNQLECGGAGPLVCCRLKPDSEGRFGFNVRGGVDLRSAVIVTRVVPHSPADMAEPTALREGDEILSINGLSTHQRSHEEVVMLIKESWKRPKSDSNVAVAGILELVVRPNTFYDYAEFERSRPVAAHNQHHHHHHLHHSRPSADEHGVVPATDLLNLSLPLCKPSMQQQSPLLNAAHQQQTPPSAAVTPLVLPSPLMGDETAILPSSADDDAARTQPDHSTLDGSMQILRDLLVEPTTALVTGFEQIYRKNANLQMNCARLAVNIPKNRYRDVLPYDETRVLLKPMMKLSSSANVLATAEENVSELIGEKEEDDDEEDYINANYIKMVIPKTGVVNHYIATQGPLASTTNDFWRMVWQEDANLIVMLTQLAEQSRPKCHQYWPALHGTLRSGLLNVICHSECLIYDDSISDSSSESSPTASSSSAFACRREFVVVNRATREERQVTHLQYMTWPDHGVPSHDSIHFLQFVQEVRMRRTGHELGAPTIIHCSAGIGRTGVLILMETAMCLIEAGEPVEPVGIVQRMRDQRGMLIQTTAQYEFVLHCIVRAFDEKLVQPLRMPTPTTADSESKTLADDQSAQSASYSLTNVNCSSSTHDDGNVAETINKISPDGDEISLSSSLMPKLTNLHIDDESTLAAAAAAGDTIPTYFAQMHQIHPATPLTKTNMNVLCSNNTTTLSDEKLLPAATSKQMTSNFSEVNGVVNHKTEKNEERVGDFVSTAGVVSSTVNGGRKPPISNTFYCSADL